jgi:hypothetical protein
MPATFRNSTAGTSSPVCRPDRGRLIAYSFDFGSTRAAYGSIFGEKAQELRFKLRNPALFEPRLVPGDPGLQQSGFLRGRSNRSCDASDTPRRTPSHPIIEIQNVGLDLIAHAVPGKVCHFEHLQDAARITLTPLNERVQRQFEV